MGRRPKCKMCGRTVTHTSHKRLCVGCSVRKNKVVIRQMRNKKGKYYKAWKLNLLDAIKRQPM